MLEVSSGSAGISLAIACKELGYNLTMIVPDLLPESRVSPIIEAGANLIRVEGYIDKCIIKLQSYYPPENIFAANHSEKLQILLYILFLE
ncbi:MAG: pyridoxal-phosphate dependent enzyme [Bacteroidetes bacterium]|nr:pyridoxal-phosphate dependent enzyme [Bacteroidota bacterium]